MGLGRNHIFFSESFFLSLQRKCWEEFFIIFYCFWWLVWITGVFNDISKQNIMMFVVLLICIYMRNKIHCEKRYDKHGTKTFKTSKQLHTLKNLSLNKHPRDSLKITFCSPICKFLPICISKLHFLPLQNEIKI